MKVCFDFDSFLLRTRNYTFEGIGDRFAKPVKFTRISSYLLIHVTFAWVATDPGSAHAVNMK